MKQEKVEKPTAEDDDDDDDLKIVGYTEATIKPVAIQEVKREPPSPPPASPKNPAEKEVRAPEEMERRGKKSLRSRKPRHRPVELL